MDAVLMLWWQGPFSLSPRLASDPLATLATFCGCAVETGAAYGAIVWRLCIRPRIDRPVAARWRESV